MGELNQLFERSFNEPKETAESALFRIGQRLGELEEPYTSEGEVRYKDLMADVQYTTLLAEFNQIASLSQEAA